MYVCHAGCLLKCPASFLFAVLRNLRNTNRVIQGQQIAPLPWRLLIRSLKKCNLCLTLCSLAFPRGKRNVSARRESLTARIATVPETLANQTGQMDGVFEKLGQFYDACRDFGQKPANFTPGESENCEEFTRIRGIPEFSFVPAESPARGNSETLSR